MNETQKTTLSILSLYMISTIIFLGIIFGMWYFGELNLLKTRSFHEVKQLSKRLIYVLAKRGKYGFFVQSLDGQKAILQAISLDSGYLIMAFDENGKLIYNNTKFDPLDIPQKNGIFIIDNHTVLNSYGRPDFLFNKEKKKRHHKKPEEDFRIVIDGGNVGKLLWNLRFKIWGLFGVLIVMMGIVGYFLVRLSLKPIYQKIQELDTFIKDATHEINTPLSVLQMSVEEIKKSEIPKDQMKRFYYIQTAARTLESIYHSLIYISFGKVENKLEVIDMQKLVFERLDFFSLLFEQKKLKIHSDLESACLKANPKSIILVLDNLLSNAYKYTQKNGEIWVRLKGGEEEASLEIEDNGFGIKAQDLNNIFQRYERFEKSKGGFGLGLNIVKKICDEFEIEIFCESEYKKGSKFILQWRIDKTDKLF